jgi:hypothetical protein
MGFQPSFSQRAIYRADKTHIKDRSQGGGLEAHPTKKLANRIPPKKQSPAEFTSAGLLYSLTRDQAAAFFGGASRFSRSTSQNNTGLAM